MGTSLGAYELNHKCTSIIRARRLEVKDVLTVKCFSRKKIGNLLGFFNSFSYHIVHSTNVERCISSVYNQSGYCNKTK